LLALLLVCLALPLTLAACGDDDDDGGGGDEDQITEVIETASTSTDPEDCSQLQTEASLEQSELTLGGETALESCEEDAPDGSTNPDSVEVSDVTVDGESATASASFTGGPQDGSTFTVALVKEGDQWKIDGITDIPEFNGEAFRAGLEEQLTSAGDVPPEVGICLTNAFAAVSDDELKALILSGSEEDFLAIIGPCIGA
jgi:hypothetical protein